MALDKCLVLVGLVMQCVAAALQAWSVLRPEPTKTVGEGNVVIDVTDFVSQREKRLNVAAFLLFFVGVILQVVSLFIPRALGNFP
jgi:hypothetical protein